MEYLVSENPTTGDLRFITVKIIDDDNYEGEHTFMMMITTSSPAAIIVRGSTTVIIQDDNGRCIYIPTSLIITDMLFCLDANVALIFDVVVFEANVFRICVRSGINGNIERELVVTLDINDGKAGKYIHLYSYQLCINCYSHFNCSCW